MEFGVPPTLARPGSVIVSISEIVAGLALLTASTAVAGAYAALILLSVFTILVGFALARGRRADCNCFGQISAGSVGPGSIARNTILMALCALVIWRAGLDRPVSSTVALVAIASTTLIIGVGAQFWVMFYLLRQNGRMLNRLDELEGNRSRDFPGKAGAVRSSSADSPFTWTRSESAAS